jgi:hypothetical protein
MVVDDAVRVATLETFVMEESVMDMVEYIPWMMPADSVGPLT